MEQTWIPLRRHNELATIHRFDTQGVGFTLTLFACGSFSSSKVILPRLNPRFTMFHNQPLNFVSLLLPKSTIGRKLDSLKPKHGE